jgi:hypothetical protein
MGSPSTDNMALEEETWYCYVLNIDQRQRKMEQSIYKRNVDEEEDAANLTSTFLEKFIVILKISHQLITKLKVTNL